MQNALAIDLLHIPECYKEWCLFRNLFSSSMDCAALNAGVPDTSRSSRS